MKYTKIPDWFREYHYKKFVQMPNQEISDKAQHDPVIFSYYYLGKKVRLHQAFIIYQILKAINSGKKKVAMCLARQLGKSILAGIFLFWAVWYNKFPATIANITACYIISRDDDAAVELLDKVRQITYEGDRHMSRYLVNGQPMEAYFSRFFKEPNNTHQLTISNSCFIKSIPPTGKVLGKSVSILFIDEAHRLSCEDPDKFFNQFARPTLAETGGIEILSSSPEGLVGFFYDAIDPDDKKENNEYERIWFDHTVWDEDTDECKRYQAFVASERRRLESEGKLKFWQQEYQAKFTVTESSFFDYRDVEASLGDTSPEYEWKKSPCSVGYDYGIKNARTVITVRTKVGDKIIQLFQYRCNAGFDTNNLVNPDWEHSIQKLKKRYNLQWIIADDCPSGDTTNRWLESNSGIKVIKFNFRSDQMAKTDGLNRNCTAYTYRARLKEGILKVPKWNERQIFEMKIVQEVEQKVLITIKAPEGQLCDCFDSDMMACIPFLDMQNAVDYSFDSIDELKEEKIDIKNPRYDSFVPLTDEECRDRVRDLNSEGIGL